MPATPIALPFPEPPPLGTTREVAPGVHWLRMPLPFALDHINLWLIADEGGWAIVDTGYALPTVQEAWREVLRRFRPTQIVVTHFHPDHLGLAAWLMAEYDLPLSMSLGEFLSGHVVWAETPGYGHQDMVRFFAEHGLAPEHQEALLARGAAYRRGVPQLPATFRRLRDGDVLTTGGRPWRVLAGMGHSPEHVSLYCEAAGVLISGDMLLPKISTNVSVWAVAPDADPLAEFLSSLTIFETLPPETLVLPSHGLPFVGIPERVAALRAHHEERLAQLLAALSGPMVAADLVKTLFPRALDTHQMVFAMGETIAHLNHAWHQGRLTRSRDADGMVRFTPKSNSATHTRETPDE